MSDHKPDLQNEEVDLGQLFNAIGKLFEKFFVFMAKIFKGLFEIIIYSLKPIVNNFKLISIAVFGAAILGFIAEKFEAPVYESDMLVKPYFDSKYQLKNNVDYFNALISEGNIEELTSIFEIDSSKAVTLVEFQMEIGPETPNDLFLEYDAYLKSIDSSLASEVTYKDFVDNRDLLAANLFSIKAIAKQNNVFKGLEKGFSKTFENDYSRRLREKRDDTIKLRRASLERQLQEVQKLQQVYVKLIEKEADNPEVSIGAEGMFPLQQTKRETKEYDLLQRELQLRGQINALDEKLVKEDVYFDILTSFEEVGSVSGGLVRSNMVVFPLIVFGVMLLSFIFVKCFVFIKNYGE